MKIETKSDYHSEFYFSQVPVGAFFIWDNEVFLKARVLKTNNYYAIHVGVSPYCDLNEEDFVWHDGEAIPITSETRIQMIIENAKIVW
jgi:hypothetical protein